MSRSPAYDPRCYDLALLFLADEPGVDFEAQRRELAQLIQELIEDYIVRCEPYWTAPTHPDFVAPVGGSTEPQDGR